MIKTVRSWGKAGLSTAWTLAKQSVVSFIDDDVLSRGASIAFYAVTAIPPTLVIVIAIGGVVFSNATAQGAIIAQLSDVIGPQSAQYLQTIIQNASGKSTGIIATMIGLVTLVISASGVFSEMKAALNIIWKTHPRGNAITRFMKTRAASLGLVMGLGILLLISLAIGTVVTALDPYITANLPFGQSVLSMLNFAISFCLGSVLFASIYKILPDADIKWHDVTVGAVATAFLFEVGKWLVSLYLGSGAISSSYGTAGGLIVLLLWIYFSAQIFLLGAEFTKAYAGNPHRRAEAPLMPIPNSSPKHE
jgi:membrane protein